MAKRIENPTEEELIERTEVLESLLESNKTVDIYLPYDKICKEPVLIEFLDNSCPPTDGSVKRIDYSTLTGSSQNNLVDWKIERKAEGVWDKLDYVEINKIVGEEIRLIHNYFQADFNQQDRIRRSIESRILSSRFKHWKYKILFTIERKDLKDFEEFTHILKRAIFEESKISIGYGFKNKSANSGGETQSLIFPCLWLLILKKK